jgi:hypothetical protein
VKEVDAGCFFKYYLGLAKWLYNDLLKETIPSKKLSQIKSRLLKHAIETKSHITHPTVRNKYKKDIALHKERILSLKETALTK